MAFNNTTTSSESFQKYYQLQDRYATIGNSIGIDPYYDGIAELLKSLLPSTDLKIADFGCGGGNLLAALKNKGFTNLTGIELSKQCVNFVSSILDIPCRFGGIEEDSKPDAQYDVAISTGVFEHLLSPKNACMYLKHIVHMQGFAFILVPDLARYVASLSAPFQDFSVEHINHFTYMTLHSLFAEAGWVELSRGEINRTVSETCNYPDMWMLFQNQNKTGKIEKDTSSKRILESYIEHSNLLLHQIDNHLKKELDSTEKYILWGVGQMGSTLLSNSVLKNKTPVLLIDANPIYRNKKINDVPIVDLNTAAKAVIEINMEKTPIIIASMRDATSIFQDIYRIFGLSSRIITLLPNMLNSEKGQI